MKMPIETRIRWSGTAVHHRGFGRPAFFPLSLGASIVLHGVSRRGLSLDHWSESSSILWALAVKDGAVRANIIVLLIAGLLPFAASGCSGSSDRFSSTKNATPVFDPSSATARFLEPVAFEGETPKLP